MNLTFQMKNLILTGDLSCPRGSRVSLWYSRGGFPLCPPRVSVMSHHTQGTPKHDVSIGLLQLTVVPPIPDTI